MLEMERRAPDASHELDSPGTPSQGNAFSGLPGFPALQRRYAERGKGFCLVSRNDAGTYGAVLAKGYPSDVAICCTAGREVAKTHSFTHSQGSLAWIFTSLTSPPRECVIRR